MTGSQSESQSQSQSQPQQRFEATDDDDDDFDSDEEEEEEEEDIVLTVENKLDLTLGMLKERIKMLEECLQKYTTQCTAQEKKIDSLEKENQAKQVKLTMLEELFSELNHYDRGSGGRCANDRNHSFRFSGSSSSSSSNNPKEEPDDNDKQEKEESSATPTATEKDQKQKGIDTTTTTARPMMSGIRQSFRSLYQGGTECQQQRRSRSQSTSLSDRGRRQNNSHRQQRGRSCDISNENTNDVDLQKQQQTKRTPPRRGLFGNQQVTTQHHENRKSRSLSQSNKTISSDNRILMNNKGDSNKKRINDLQLKIQQQLQGAVVTDTTTTTNTKARYHSGSVVGAAGSAATTTTTRTKTRMNKVRIKFKKGQLEGVYTGPLVDRKPHGAGTIRFMNGDTYSGEMDQGKMSGMGTLYTKTRGVQPVFANNKFMAIPSLLVVPPATTAVGVVPQTAAVSPTTTTTSSSNINK